MANPNFDNVLAPDTGYNVENMPQGARDLLYGPQSDTSKVIHELLDDDIVKAKMKDTVRGSELWSIFTKSFILTFVNEIDADIMRHKFKESLIALRSMIPDWNWGDNERMLFKNLEIMFEANIGRALGTDQNKVNERTLISTQIQHRTSVYAESGLQQRTGVRAKIAGFFGR